MAPPLDPPTTITLRIKVAPGHVTSGADEFTLGNDIPVASRVGQIRERIQQTLPTNPTPERQRILYAGRALVDNDVTLAEALNIRRDPSQNEYVVHLLVKGDGTNTAPVPPRRPLSAGAAPVMASSITPGNQVPAAPQTAQTSSAQPNPAMLHHAATHQHHHHHHQVAVAQAQQMQARMLAGSPFAQRMVPQAGGLPIPQGSFGGSPFPPGGWPGPHVAAGVVPRLGQQDQGQEGLETASPSVQNGGANLGQQTDGSQPQAQPNVQHRPAAGAQHAHIQGVLPSGERITIHQQTMTFPQGAMPPPHLHHGLRPMQSMVPTSASIPGSGPVAGPSALDRARENIASMRQLLEELREHNGPASLEQQARIARLQERTQALNNYIDPLHLGTVNNAPVRRTNTPNGPQTMHAGQTPIGHVSSWQQRAQQMRQAQQPAINTNRSTSDVTCYLLSSPTGPRAILYSSEHGAYTGSLQAQSHASGTTLRSSAMQTTLDRAGHAPAAEGQPNANAIQVPVQPAIQAAAAAQPDPMGPMGPFLGHFWLTLRILIFSYFLLGSNMGWRRPIALAAIGLGFWLIRIGVQGDGPIRRWWEGVMNHDHPPRAVQAGQDGQQPVDVQGRAGQMPTPEQLAQRLIEQADRARGQARDGRVQWVRERIRPVERAVALLVASLWPGVGEAYVRAREEEDRRRAEEEVAARRAEEEAKKKREDEEKQKIDEGAGSKQDVDAAASANNAEAGSANEIGKSAATHQAFSA